VSAYRPACIHRQNQRCDTPADVADDRYGPAHEANEPGAALTAPALEEADRSCPLMEHRNTLVNPRETEAH